LKFRQISLGTLIKAFQLFHLARFFAEEEGTCLLYSGTEYETARHSFLFLFPIEVIKIHGTIQERRLLNKVVMSTKEINPWKAMSLLGADIGKGEGFFPDWVGFFGYEMGAYSDPDKVVPHRKSETPEAYWQRCAVTLMFDHQSGESFVRVLEEPIAMNKQIKLWLQKLSIIDGWQDLLSKIVHENPVKSQIALKSISDTPESYIQKVERALDFIKKGDFYQINLSQQWEFLGKVNPYHLFFQLTTLNPAPFSAYFHLKDFTIVSSSPERFLQSQAGKLETRPIKGTLPRGIDADQDKINKQCLLNSEKERAELMMITDLMRNDLGKISCSGSVTVPLLCGIEAYKNVFHLHSIVISKLLASVSPIDAIQACFPGGSITGCPKLRAMEAIDQIEQRPRGIYTGSIGYFSCDGGFDFNIAIRTLVLIGERINLQLGGGIVMDSDPQKEFEETYHKGQSIFEVLRSCTKTSNGLI
jgi:para-aminobenzoate synthetase component 1